MFIFSLFISSYIFLSLTIDKRQEKMWFGVKGNYILFSLYS